MLRYRLNGVVVHRRSETDDRGFAGHVGPDFFSSLAGGPK